MSRLWLLFPLLVACAKTNAAPSKSGATTLLAFDNNQVEGTIAFPHAGYESVVRFELPPGEHRITRLWIQMAAPGTIRWTLYDQNVLESPGDAIAERSRVVVASDVSNGHDGRWITEAIDELGAQKGVLWLGIRMELGEPTIAASRADSRQYYVRSNDPKNPMDLLPVKRTPMVRLEIAPK